MTALNNLTKRKLEHLLGMGSGYVLDFSNDSFAAFVKTAIGIDPYVEFDPSLSKAKLLRRIWESQDPVQVHRLVAELLEHWRTSELLSGRDTPRTDLVVYEELREEFQNPPSRLSTEDLQFLEEDFQKIDFEQLSKDLTAQDLIQSRISEMESCVENGSYLAVMFLAGSTIEGLLLEVADKNSKKFASVTSAPKDKQGKTLPFANWRLASLIAVSRELNVLSDDTSRFADSIRNFRNYIQPRQQARESFQPRLETAKIALQVVRATLTDLQHASSIGQKR